MTSTRETSGINRANGAFQLPTTRSIPAAGHNRRVDAMASCVISRSPMRSSRSSSTRAGSPADAGRRNHRSGAAANPFRGPVDHNPFEATAAPQDFLRALFIHLSLAPEAPGVRADLLLVLIDALRRTNSPYLRVGTG